MITTITIEHRTEEEIIPKIKLILKKIKDGTIDDHELMDGSYAFDDVAIELEE